MARRQRKATDDPITISLLDSRSGKSLQAGYGKAKWIIFCEVLLRDGYKLSLYEARRTVSKYITVSGDGASPFKVRFSNHRPISAREVNGDCNFFVGVTNQRTTTTGQAIAAVREHFKKPSIQG